MGRSFWITAPPWAMISRGNADLRNQERVDKSTGIPVLFPRQQRIWAGKGAGAGKHGGQADPGHPQGGNPLYQRCLHTRTNPPGERAGRHEKGDFINLNIRMDGMEVSCDKNGIETGTDELCRGFQAFPEAYGMIRRIVDGTGCMGRGMRKGEKAEV